MEISKVCFKCQKDKPLCEYYKHKQMADGHLNKCKDCAKGDSLIRHNEKVKDQQWVESEKVRAREKYNRLGYRDIHKPTPERKKEIILAYEQKYPEKIRAKSATSHLKAKVKGNQLHHWSYNDEHTKDVIELSVTEHKKLHRYMIYDQERKMYRTADLGVLLDTKEVHERYYESLMSRP